MAANVLQKQPGRGPGRPFAKGRSGNPAGRAAGSRNRATLIAQAMLDDEAAALTRKAVELALDVDEPEQTAPGVRGAARRCGRDRTATPTHGELKLTSRRDARTTKHICMAALQSGMGLSRVTNCWHFVINEIPDVTR